MLHKTTQNKDLYDNLPRSELFEVLCETSSFSDAVRDAMTSAASSAVLDHSLIVS